MIQWMADPSRVNSVSAWGFIITFFGLLITIVGLYLTYIQARNAKISAEKLKIEIERFNDKRNISDALGWLGEARAAMDNAGLLIVALQWRDACSVYDEARKHIQKTRVSCHGLSSISNRKLKLISEHLSAFANQVDAARADKGEYPDISATRASIRRNTDDLVHVIKELGEGIG